jgi:hypothetical protein
MDGLNTFKTSGLSSTLMAIPRQSEEVEKFMSDLFNSRSQVQFQVTNSNGNVLNGSTGAVVNGGLNNNGNVPTDFATLSVLDKNNRSVIFNGKIKPSVKFNSPGEIEFFEIRPNNLNNLNINSNAPFIIRQVFIDSNGIQRSVSDWKPYFNQINDLNGLNQNESIGVRVKKFVIKNQNNNQNNQTQQDQFAYFLDLIFSRTTLN